MDGKLPYLLFLILILSSIVAAYDCDVPCVLVDCSCLISMLAEKISYFVILLSSIFVLMYSISYLRERKEEKKGKRRSSVKIGLMFLVIVLIPLMVLLILAFPNADMWLLWFFLAISLISFLFLGVLLKFHKRMQSINHLFALASALPIIVAVAILLSGISEQCYECLEYAKFESNRCDEKGKIEYALENDKISVCDELIICRDYCYEQFAIKRKD